MSKTTTKEEKLLISYCIYQESCDFMVIKIEITQLHVKICEINSHFFPICLGLGRPVFSRCKSTQQWKKVNAIPTVLKRSRQENIGLLRQ